MPAKPMNQDQVVSLLLRRQGKKPDTQYAAELGVSASLLSLVRAKIVPPGPKILRGLGLRIVYIPETRNGR